MSMECPHNDRNTRVCIVTKIEDLDCRWPLNGQNEHETCTTKANLCSPIHKRV